MSSRRELHVSARAAIDIRGILKYTLRRWGVAQHDDYAAKLERGLERLVDYPESGRARDDLRPGYRSFQVEQHVVYYWLDGDVVRVVRVLHEKMDAQKRLGRRTSGGTLP
jgi:toxin ParE1/3/4